MDGTAAVCHLLAHCVGKLLVKAHQHLVDDIQGVLGGGKFVGVGVEIALQAVIVPHLQILEEGEGVVVVGRHILQVLHAGHTLLLQQREDLIHGVALGNGHGDGGPGGRVGTHAGQQGPVVHIGVQGEGACHHVVLAAGEGGKEIEEELIFDESLVLELFSHITKAVVIGNGNGSGLLWFVQSQHVVGSHPADAGQQRGHADDKNRIDGRSAQARALFPAPCVG